MIKQSQPFRIKIIFVSAIITLLALSFFSYTKINNLVNEVKWINQTNLVKLSLEKTFVALKEKESNIRVYMLTHDTVYLTAFSAADSDIYSALNNFESITKDNPTQKQNAIALRTAIDARIAMMKHNLKLFQTSNVSIPDLLTGQALMDTVRNQIDKVGNAEDQQLRIRSAAFRKAEFLTPFYTIVLTIGSIIILIAAYLKIMQELKISDKLKSKVEGSTNELLQANKELALQNEEKEKRSAELVIANKELAFQNEEKEKRAAELAIANKELIFQNEEKEKRAAELVIVNKELESFNYISSHDLQEPLRKIQTFASRLIGDESQNLSVRGKDYAQRMQDAANRMQALIADLLAYSRTTSAERKFETTDLNIIIESVKKDFAEIIDEKKAIIEVGEMCDAYIIPFQFRQLMNNIIGNALKFAKPDVPPHIIVKSRIIKGSEANNPKLLSEKEYCHITITDNGIGFEPKYKEHIFELFKRLHDREQIKGTGIGLTIVKKIVENHNGFITATSEINKGATFDIYIPYA